MTSPLAIEEEDGEAEVAWLVLLFVLLFVLSLVPGPGGFAASAGNHPLRGERVAFGRVSLES